MGTIVSKPFTVDRMTTKIQPLGSSKCLRRNSRPQLLQSSSERSIGYHLRSSRTNMYISKELVQHQEGTLLRTHGGNTTRRSSVTQVSVEEPKALAVHTDAAVVAITTALRSFLLESSEMYQKIPSLMALMTQLTVPIDTILCTEGERMKAIYILQSGFVEICYGKKLDCTKRAGSLICQDLLLYRDEPAKYTATATSECILWVLAADQLEQVELKASPTSIVKRISLLIKVQALNHLTSAQFHQVAQLMTRVTRQMGEECLGSETTERIFIVERGELQYNGQSINTGQLFIVNPDHEPPIVTSISAQYGYVAKETIQNELNLSLKELKCDTICRSNMTLTRELTLDALEPIAVIGKGSFGTVSMMKDQTTGYVYAVKQMFKRDILDADQVQQVFNEKNVLLSLNHPFIVKMHGTFQDAESIYIATDVVQGGELWRLIHQDQPLSLPAAQFYTANVVLALMAMHRENIIYRDIKPENLMVDATGYLQVIDMGFAKQMAPYTAEMVGMDTRSTTICGTPDYLAPEFILGSGYGMAVDIWAVGVLLFEMLTGFTPFNRDGTADHNSIFAGIIQSEINGIEFPKHFGKKYPTAKKFIEQLLHWCPRKRLGCGLKGFEELKKHSFFKKIDWEKIQSKTQVAPYVPDLADQLDRTNLVVDDEEDDEEESVTDTTLDQTTIDTAFENF